MSDIVLSDRDGTSAVIAPSRGGALLRYRRRTTRGPVDVLHDPPGSHPMFPIAGFSHAGPLADHYCWEGVTRPLPIHGFAMRRPWQVVEAGRSSARLALSADAETRAVYPFEFRLRLSYALEAGAIVSRLDIDNAGDRPMPFSAGFHPYIRLPLAPAGLRDRCVVRLPPCREVFARPEGIVRDDRHAARVLPATMPAAPARSFTDLGSLRAELVDGLGGLSVALEASLGSAFRCLTAWSPAIDAPFYCVEPRTALQDAFSHAGTDAGQDQLTVLAPGATFSARMTLALRETHDGLDGAPGSRESPGA